MNELKNRDVIYWEETWKQEYNLCEILEKRDKAIKEELTSRDSKWLNNLQHCRDSLRIMSHEQVNNRTLMESLAKRQRELTKSNAKILDWDMKTVSGKKKVSLPQIRISDCIPYTIVPPDVTDPLIHFSHPNPSGEIPFVPCRAPPQNKTSGTIRKEELTPEEEVEEYLIKEAVKEKSSKASTCPKPNENE